MSVWAALAVLTKPQSLMLAPVWLVCLLRSTPADRGRRDGGRHGVPNGDYYRRIIVPIVAAALTAAVVTVPFVTVGGAAGIRDSLLGAVERYPVMHLNGFSAWFLVNPLERSMLGAGGGHYRSDRDPWLMGLAPRSIGLGALVLAALGVAVVLWRNRCRLAALHWAARVMPLAFFILPTQIHERYLFPAIALWAWAYAPTPRWWAGWLLVATAAFVNTAWVWPGAPGSAAAEWLSPLVHAKPSGAPIGVFAAVLLLLILAATIYDSRLFRYARQRTAARGYNIAQ
jgi:hypothetical protein